MELELGRSGCPGGSIRQWARQRKKECVEEGEEGVIGREMGWRRKAITNYCRLREGKGIGKWWENRIGRIENAACPRCGEEDNTPYHIVFRCMKIKRIKDEKGKGRREWGEIWDALASRKWVGMEDTGRVDDEGRAVFERVDLMEVFFGNIHHQI